jgi:Kef-type K+ transport system membrane component KefB
LAIPDSDLSIPSAASGRLRVWGAYAAMLVAAVALFFVINYYGARLTAPGRTQESFESRVGGAGSSEALAHVLIVLGAVLVLGRLLAVGFRWLGQPPVIGEVVAGILLGPSLLGQVWPEAQAFLLPPSVAPNLGMIAQLGVILYMFIIGLELNPELLRQRAHATVAISHASIVAPFVLGNGLALFLYPRLSTSDVPFASFALFMGAAMSITAFPVLARILTDRGMHKSPLGVMALGCAAAGDVTAWCLLAFVVGVAHAKLGDAFVVLGCTLAYIGFMFLVARPIAKRFFQKFGEQEISANLVAVVLALLLGSALLTEYIGIHAVFGAFLLGAIIPHDSAVARALSTRLVDLVTVLLLPAFLAFTGMRTQIGLVSGFDQWLVCGLIIVVATAGKFGGTLAAARLTGLSWRDATSLGLLMNTRGLMELIVLNIGLDLRVISPTLFAMMVLMALATTMAAAPLIPASSGRKSAGGVTRHEDFRNEEGPQMHTD